MEQRRNGLPEEGEKEAEREAERAKQESSGVFSKELAAIAVLSLEQRCHRGVRTALRPFLLEH